MNASLFAAMSALPAETQAQIVGNKVNANHPIDLTYSDISYELNALVSTFADHKSLLKIAQLEVFRTNTFVVSESSSIVTWHHGTPSIVSTATGQVLTKCPEIRHLQVILHNTLQGADWNITPSVILPTTTMALLAVLPTIFPHLTDITVEIINVSLVASGAKYTKWHKSIPAAKCPEWRHAERASRMYQLMRAVHKVNFPLWRRNEPVKKSLLFVQSMRAGAEGHKPNVVKKSGPSSFQKPNNNQLSKNTEKRMWDWSGLPLVKIVYV